MKKFYAEPEAEVIEIDSSVAIFTLSVKEEITGFNDGDGDDIDDL